MKRKLLDILACPIDKFYPLELLAFEEKDEIVSGLLLCTKCNRWYPIIDQIPHMLADDLREEKEDVQFLEEWQSRLPAKVLKEGVPFHLKAR